MVTITKGPAAGPLATAARSPGAPLFGSGRGDATLALWPIATGSGSANNANVQLIQLPALAEIDREALRTESGLYVQSDRFALWGQVRATSGSLTLAWFAQVVELLPDGSQCPLARVRATKGTFDAYSYVDLRGYPYPVFGGYITAENPNTALIGYDAYIATVNRSPWH